MAAIITAYEATKYGPGDIHFDPNFLCPYLDIVEEAVFNSCLGWEMYESLQADLEPLPSNFFTYNTQYQVGDKVVWQGVAYEALKLVTNIEPTNDLVNWKMVQKFSTNANNVLWESYLRKLIAFGVSRKAQTTSTIKATNLGLVRSFSESSNPASVDEISMVRNDQLETEKMIRENMIKFIERNEESFPDYAGFSNLDCGTDDGCKVKYTRTNGFF
jgi:hypothetical protein